MSTYQEVYKHLCRICLSYSNGEEMVSLIDNNGLSDYGKAVLSFAKISIQLNDKLPRLMCKNCLLSLKQGIYFKLRCEFSEKQLKHWLQLYQSTKEFTFEEIALDNIMLRKYLPEVTTENTKVRCDVLKVTITRESDNDSVKNGSITSSEILNEKCFQDSDIDSSDELLNIMEENISQYSNIKNTKYYNNMHQNLIHRKRRQAKVMKVHLKNQEIHNALKMKRLKMKMLMQRAISKEKYFCDKCNRHLANRSSYRYHMQRHNGCSYMCEHCGKGFAVMAELKLHQVARHGTGPYIECKLCNFKTSRNFELIEHERLHTGERPYTCDKCGLTFRRRAIWRKHMIYHTEKTVQCPQCPRKFFRQSEMLAHINGMHDRLYLYSCHKCDTTYAKTASVRRHLIEKHGIPREEQGKIIRINKKRYEIKS